MTELTLREDPGGRRYIVAVRCSRPLRPAQRRQIEDVVRQHPGLQYWDRAGVVVRGLYLHRARVLMRHLAAELGLELPG